MAHVGEEAALGDVGAVGLLARVAQGDLGPLARVDLAQKYNRYANTGVRYGLISAQDADLDEYVTQKALDGLYFMVGEEEKKIRRDPVGTASSLLQKVFGELLK